MKRTASLASAAVLGIALATPLAADTCDPIMPNVTYCSEIEQWQSWSATYAFPDLIGGYRFRIDGNLVVSNVVVMPYDREIKSPDDAMRMMLRQFMDIGGAGAASIEEVRVGPSTLAGQTAERAYFEGLNGNGGTFAIYVVEVVQRPEALMMVFTELQGRRAKENMTFGELEAVHETSLANLEFN
ncbi:hypothetical protein [Tateyamaria sp. ANG-S1]|uniref:hypothetical protein n=1 Tax=Tateyamaria sp. ANG-S1 TaxID=1577905 RepID=UPI00057E5A84|nr:hypothetical protein [Tateyamaria sp. ANG-S1]KIC48785.1 hypothetical protein RA29_13940 [Tateyamaria sp. ANG-S1]